MIETAKQMGIKLTGVRGTATVVPKRKQSEVRRAKSRRCISQIFAAVPAYLHGPMGPYIASTGGAKYLMQLVDDHTNFGWVAFLRDKSGSTVD
ncbi:unnamed protein product, partial [Pylaiella littoralis]